MDQVETYLSLVDMALNLCSALIKMAMNVKANQERCQRVAQRVKSLEELLLTIKQRDPGQISAVVENALRELCTTLASAKGLIVRYSQTNPAMSFLKSSSHEDKFCKLNERLTDNFQVLSGALQIEHGNMLRKVYETVSGKRPDGEYCSGQPLTSPSSLAYSIPTTPMPLPAMPPMPMSIPTTPMPLPTMPPMPMSIPTTPIPVPYIMSPMPLLRPMAPMPFSTTIVSRPALATVPPIVISSTIAPRPVLHLMAPVQAPCTVASMPLTRSFAPMTFLPPNTSVVRTYVVNNNSFSP